MRVRRISVRIELAEAGVAKQLISAKRNSGSEEIEQTRTEGSTAKLSEREANPRGVF